MKTFNDFSLDARIARGVQAAGFSTPTPIQAEAIPAILSGQDVMGLAQTGTGKTAAFVLPILQRLIKTGHRSLPRALIIAPTRELAEQIHESIRELGRFTNLSSTTVYGGVSRSAQVRALRKGVDIVVACPGRLLDLMGDKSIRLHLLEVVVLDEADRMCDMGFLPDIRRILRAVPAQRQTLFFSATMPDDIRHLSREILRKPVVIQIGMTAPAHTVSHAIFPVERRAKTSLLMAWLERTATGRVLVFTRTKRQAERLARDLERAGHRATALQGNMSQNQRQRAIRGFRQGKHDILVATDVAARGIDVPDITHVINYDMPDTVDAYIHRIGRTGRANKGGEALTFVTGSDYAMVRSIERLLKARLERRRLQGVSLTPNGRKRLNDSETTDSSAPASTQSTRRPVRSRRDGRSWR